MKIEIGKTYRVKPESVHKCKEYSRARYACQVKFDDTYYLILDDKGNELDCCDCFEADDLTTEVTLDNLISGDVVENKYGNKKKVLHTLRPGLYVISFVDVFKRAAGSYTTYDLEKDGCKPVTLEEVEELTVEEISKRLGKTIKVVE